MASSPSNPCLPLLMEDEKTLNWAELPPEITSSILLRLSMQEILENAQRVCTSWRRVCRDPSMWRKIDMRSKGEYNCGLKEVMCRLAVDLSQGGLLEIDIEYFGTDSLITYIAQRSSNLRRLGLCDCSHLTSLGIFQAVVKLPLLEELKLSYCSIEEQHLEAIGQACPNLKKLNLKYVNYMAPGIGRDEDALAIAKTMPGLRHLQLLANRLSDTGLNAILDCCPHLEHLDLRRCFNIDLVGNLGKRCYERIKDVRPPSYYSTAKYPLYVLFPDTDLDEDFDYEDYTYGSYESDDSEEYVYLGCCDD